jgi:DNA invertase Pin-like site-specific DNA recombinase
MGEYVAYLRKLKRVPLKEQRKSVEDFNPIAEYVEDDGDGWPELGKAVDHATKVGATLVIARLHRLARSVAVTKMLLESGVDFVCCDNRRCTKDTIHVFAALADEESRQVSQAVRDRMASLKKRGVKLGSARKNHWKGKERGWRKAVPAASKKRQEETAKRYEYIIPQIRAYREADWSLQEIADRLNADGHRTTAMQPFTEVAVYRLIKRYIGDVGKVARGRKRREPQPVSNVRVE